MQDPIKPQFNTIRYIDIKFIINIPTVLIKTMFKGASTQELIEMVQCTNIEAFSNLQIAYEQFGIKVYETFDIKYVIINSHSAISLHDGKYQYTFRVYNPNYDNEYKLYHEKYLQYQEDHKKYLEYQKSQQTKSNVISQKQSEVRNTYADRLVEFNKEYNLLFHEGSIRNNEGTFRQIAKVYNLINPSNQIDWQQSLDISNQSEA